MYTRKTLQELTLKDNFMFGAVMCNEEICRKLLELVKFLEYVRAGLDESTRDFEDPFVKSIQETVHSVKESREMEVYYMGFKEMLDREYSAGRTEGRTEGLAESVLDLLADWDIPDELFRTIKGETDPAVLKRWIKLAAKAESLEQFLNEM